MRHVQRGLDGGNQATGIGFARTCQVQGRAVIDRSADKGQAESDVHAFAETGIFEHRQPLVVVHGKDGIGIFEQEGLGTRYRPDTGRARLCLRPVGHEVLE